MKQLPLYLVFAHGGEWAYIPANNSDEALKGFFEIYSYLDQFDIAHYEKVGVLDIMNGEGFTIIKCQYFDYKNKTYEIKQILKCKIQV